MKGQYDIMEQEKQIEEKKEANITPKVYIGIIIAMIVMVLALVIRISTLENKINSFQGQVEELSLTLGTRVNVDETETEPQSDVRSDTKEQAENGSVEVGDIEANPDADVADEIKHKVYLTFDDGPSANTEAILDILDQYNVKATFFVLGKEDNTSIERLQMIYERGHTIGMHSYSHVYSDIYYSLDNFKADFWKSKQYLLDAIGADCLYYRFPGGSSNTAANMNMQECIDFLSQQGVEYYDWNVVSGDGSSRKLSKETIIKNCTESITNYGTSIILLHDASSKKETVEALPEIIEAILAIEGAAILPITEETKAVHHVISQSKPEQPIPDSTGSQSEDGQEVPEESKEEPETEGTEEPVGGYEEVPETEQEEEPVKPVDSQTGE